MKKLLQFTSVFLFSMLLCFYAVPEAAEAADIVTVSADMKYGQQEARDMLQLVNAFRTNPSEAWYWNEDDQTKTTESDLQPLTYDYSLEKAAMLRAAEVAFSFSHTRPNGERCFTAYQDSSYQAYGENIAAGQSTGSSVFTSWQENDDQYAGQGHRRNMLGRKFNAIGIGHVYYNGTHYWVQEFGYTSSPNVNAAPSSEGTETVALEVRSSNISNLSLACSKNAISMKAGESAALPEVSLTINVAEHWPNNRSMPVKSLGNTEAASPQWTCTNTDIATVNADGTITAVAAGKTTITAACRDLTASCEVTVRPASPNTSNGSGSNNGSSNTSNDSGSNNGSSNTPVIPTSPITPTAPEEQEKPSDPDSIDQGQDNSSAAAVSVKKAQLKNVENSGKGKITVKWKLNKNNTGYRIAYSTKKNFAAGSTKMKSAGASSSVKTISGLKKGKTYYVRIQGYKTVNGKKQYGSWSSTKKVKIKK